ncbi:MAG TPA: SelT/SelW/SelH family protein [Bacteroidetes bacterium]|nr:SelT/SelW/SelH family protein [Bacteroidota bacterium]
MKAALEEKFPGIQITLIESSGGRFEVMHDGRLIFSKKQTRRFPQHSEIIAALETEQA